MSFAVSPLAQRTAKKLPNDTEDATLTVAIELVAMAQPAATIRGFQGKGLSHQCKTRAEIRRALKTRSFG
jgi:hypothetical protein